MLHRSLQLLYRKYDTTPLPALSDSCHSRAEMPPAVEARDVPSTPEPRSLEDIALPSGSPVSRRTFSRRQARLVQREEQPLLESRDAPVVVEQRSTVPTRRYPRRAYYEHYEKRSPDSEVIPATSSVKVARDDGHHRSHHCDCGNGLNMRSLISLVRRYNPCPCESPSLAYSPYSMQQPPQPAQCSGPACGGNMMGNPAPPMGMNGSYLS